MSMKVFNTHLGGVLVVSTPCRGQMQGFVAKSRTTFPIIIYSCDGRQLVMALCFPNSSLMQREQVVITLFPDSPEISLISSSKSRATRSCTTANIFSPASSIDSLLFSLYIIQTSSIRAREILDDYDL